jgi:HD superfamily phosphohydrolase
VHKLLKSDGSTKNMDDGRLVVDNNYGHIRLSALQDELRATQAVELADRVTQLGLVKQTYENATHNRREHSVGTSILVSKYADALNLNQKDRNILEAAAMLHDIGHMAFAHSGAKYFKEKWGFTQEELSKHKIHNDVKLNGVLLKYEINPEIVADLIFDDDFVRKHGKKFRYLKQLISGSLDVDRIDFLRRDARSTAIYGSSVEYQRLLEYSKIENHARLGKIVVYPEAVLPAIKAFFSAYNSAYESVYFHTKVQKEEAMLNKALFIAHDYIEKKFSQHKGDPSQIRESTLTDALLDLPKDRFPVARNLVEMIFCSNSLPKDIAFHRSAEQGANFLAKFNGATALESHLTNHLKAQEGEIIVIDNTNIKPTKESDVFIKLSDSGFASASIVNLGELVDMDIYAKHRAQRRPLRIISVKEEYRQGILDILQQMTPI